MSKYGLTRVQFRGENAVIVSGPIPPDLAARGLTKELVAAEPAPALEEVRTIPKKANRPPRFVAPAKPEVQASAPAEKEGK